MNRFEAMLRLRGLRGPISDVLEVVAHNDLETENEHVVRMGPGQRTGLRLLLHTLDDWKRTRS